MHLSGPCDIRTLISGAADGLQHRNKKVMSVRRTTWYTIRYDLAGEVNLYYISMISLRCDGVRVSDSVHAVAKMTKIIDIICMYNVQKSRTDKL